MWLSPKRNDLAQVVSSANNYLLLCSPYISRPGLDIISDNLPPSVQNIDIWTKLSAEDWLVGASQPDGLLEFIEAQRQNIKFELRESSRLHAKIIYSDGDQGLAGSSNLTAGGFGNNIEVVNVVAGDELKALGEFANSIRQWLNPVSLASFSDFVRRCLEKIDTQEALLQLIRDESPESEPALILRAIIPYGDFLEALEPSNNSLHREIITIARNHDGNNNSGKVKQAFYGVQRFLQEYPQHIPFVSGLPAGAWFEVASSPLNDDWVTFLSDFGDEASSPYSYSIPTLIRYLTPNSGGTRTGGGGGDNELKRVWQAVGRMMAGAG